MSYSKKLFYKFDTWIEKPRWKDEHPFDWTIRPISEEELHKAIRKLDGWVTRMEWKGYDPFDLKELAVYRKTKWMPDDARYYTKLLRYILYKGAELDPKLMRRLFLIRKKHNPKGIGLFAHSYCLMAKLFDNDLLYITKGKKCIDLLLRKKLQQYNGICWGYPFDWESIIPIPKNTPSAVVTTTVGQAFLEWFTHTGNNEYIQTCSSICDFLLKDLNLDYIGNEKVCFSYTPIDSFHVHNANLLTAAFLTRVGSILENEEFLSIALKAVKYSLSEQQEDGSFYYWGPPSDEDYSLRKEQYELVDHLHTGYVLRSLHSIFVLNGKSEILDSIRLGYDLYRRKLFEKNFVPKYQTDRLFPVDIHFCAEAILTLTQLDELFPGSLNSARIIAGWLLDCFQDEDGYFYAAMRENKMDHIAYMRWGQAWMLLALTSLALQLKSGNRTDT